MAGPDADRPLVRLGGWLVLDDGAQLAWSVADGRRGRRWRAVATHEDAISDVLLLELDPAGRPLRLELATPAGLLTLHPEPDERTIHGNVVGPDGVRPLALAWSPEHELDVVGRPLALAAGLHRRRSRVGVGAATRIPVVSIERDLAVVGGEATVRRLDEGRWAVEVGPDRASFVVAVDPDGVPAGGERWPLEP